MAPPVRLCLLFALPAFSQQQIDSRLPVGRDFASGCWYALVSSSDQENIVVRNKSGLQVVWTVFPSHDVSFAMVITSDGSVHRISIVIQGHSIGLTGSKVAW